MSAEVLDRDPVETTITYDHDRKTVMGWTNCRHTSKLWLKEYPANTRAGSGYVELKVPMDEFIPTKKLKRPAAKRVLSEEHRRASAERLRLCREARVASVG